MPAQIDYGRVFIAFAILWFVQAIMTFRQSKAISKEFSDIKKSNTGYLGTGTQRAKFNLGRGVILVLVIGFDETIKDFRILSGISVMVRFKKRPEYIGLTIDQAREKIKTQPKTVVKAFEQAVQNINNEREKHLQQN